MGCPVSNSIYKMSPEHLLSCVTGLLAEENTAINVNRRMWAYRGRRWTWGAWWSPRTLAASCPTWTGSPPVVATYDILARIIDHCYEQLGLHSSCFHDNFDCNQCLIFTTNSLQLWTKSAKHYWRGNLKQSKLKTTIKLKFTEICTTIQLRQ